MERAGVVATRQHPFAVQQQHSAVLQGNDAHRQRFHIRAGKGFRKQPAGGDHCQYAAVSVVVIPDDLHLAGKHHAHKFRGIALQKHRIAFGNAGDFSAQTA